MSYPKPHHISIADTVAHLVLPDAKSLFKIRAACKRGALPFAFPALGPGGFLENEVHALKINLLTFIAQSNPPSTPTHQPTNSSPVDRRANPDRRGGNRG